MFGSGLDFQITLRPTGGCQALRSNVRKYHSYKVAALLQMNIKRLMINIITIRLRLSQHYKPIHKYKLYFYTIIHKVRNSSH